MGGWWLRPSAPVPLFHPRATCPLLFLRAGLLSPLQLAPGTAPPRHGATGGAGSGTSRTWATQRGRRHPQGVGAPPGRGGTLLVMRRPEHMNPACLQAEPCGQALCAPSRVCPPPPRGLRGRVKAPLPRGPPSLPPPGQAARPARDPHALGQVGIHRLPRSRVRSTGRSQPRLVLELEAAQSGEGTSQHLRHNDPAWAPTRCAPPPTEGPRASSGSRCTCHLGILPPPTTSTRHKPPRGAQSQGRSYTHLSSSWHPTSRNNIHKSHTTRNGPEPGQVLDTPVIFLGPYRHEQHSLALPVLASQAAVTNTTDRLG